MSLARDAFPVDPNSVPFHVKRKLVSLNKNRDVCCIINCKGNLNLPGAMYPTVPGMLVNVMEFSVPASSLEIPKSETCAIMS